MMLMPFHYEAVPSFVVSHPHFTSILKLVNGFPLFFVMSTKPMTYNIKVMIRYRTFKSVHQG